MTTNNVAANKLSDQLTNLIQNQFSGRLDIQGVITTWSLYFCLGRLVWTSGGCHVNRRWYRHLSQYLSQVSADDIRLRQGEITPYWEYLVLIVLVKRQKITGEQAVAVIKSAVSEVLFDILQQEEKAPLAFSIDQQEVLDASLTLINPEKALRETLELWQDWTKAGLTNISPNLAPVIKQAEELKQLASPKVYETLIKVANGKRTIRDVAVFIKQDTLTVMRSLVPYIRKKVIGLTEIPDAPKPTLSITAPPPPTARVETVTIPNPPGQTAIQTTSPPKTAPPKTAPPAPTPPPSLNKPLVAYVEDSEIDCQIMQGLVSKAGYGFVSIRDSIQALPLLLQHKPDLIFLDLVMPVANGYEICTQIRRISNFKNIPVIIVTGNDGIVDRVRAKLAGASDFLSKPVGENKVLPVLQKYLNSASSFSPNEGSNQSLGYQPS
ncbi:response regulator [Aerosakkonemataceae cyanobacterium BLCC-F154]|uniref:Protein PatA n=1 Tax=Floridaenema fluviatile BLCC-F154 TaxID=3153640 RepID=A0ABV4YAY0_9CYAN